MQKYSLVLIVIIKCVLKWLTTMIEQSRIQNKKPIDSQLWLQKMFCHEKGFPISNSALYDIAEILCPEITRSNHILPLYGIKNEEIPGTMCVSHLISPNLKINFPNIPSLNVANPATRKR